jgi:hypothetical protein
MARSSRIDDGAAETEALRNMLANPRIGLPFFVPESPIRFG